VLSTAAKKQRLVSRLGFTRTMWPTYRARLCLKRTNGDGNWNISWSWALLIGLSGHQRLRAWRSILRPKESSLFIQAAGLVQSSQPELGEDSTYVLDSANRRLSDSFGF
jgi:hypothetical protein